MLLITLKSHNIYNIAVMMSKIILYDKIQFSGQGKELMGSVADLGSASYCSLKMEGKHWVGYTGTNVTTEFTVYGAGDHANLGEMDKKIQSLRLVQESLLDPEVNLYEDNNFHVESCHITETIRDLSVICFNNRISSHVVKAGAWVLSQEMNFHGLRTALFLGDQCSDCSIFGWDNKLSCVRFLQNSDHKVGNVSWRRA
ncbi:epidermal differentiation-specific protein-like [Heterodontus francisci]|uniref:epidermal differentiation-specific protein-like n=1 Tax=Heterodontus francisci TaxID=7792 RepID=UPI00355C8CF6